MTSALNESTRNGSRMMAALKSIMPRLRPDYLIERATWSATITYVLFTGLVTLIALPMERRIGEVSAQTGGTITLFSALFCLLFGVLSITIGQSERRWRARLEWGAQLRQLSVRILFVLVLSLPYWAVYLMAHVGSLTTLVLIFLHLWLWGVALGLAGWRLALTPWSDIVQFNVKYAGFFGYLLLSGLGQLIPLVALIGPFRTLDGVIAGGPAAWPLLLQGAVVWIGVGLGLIVSLRRSDERSQLPDG